MKNYAFMQIFQFEKFLAAAWSWTKIESIFLFTEYYIILYW